MNKWNRENIELALDWALRASAADDAVVTVSGFHEGATRYANSEINQNVVRSDLSISVQAAFGASTGSASTNAMDKDSVVACVKRAEDIARLTPPDPEYMPPVVPMDLPKTKTWFPRTAEFSPADRAAAVARAIAVAEKNGLTGAGAFKTRARVLAVGNSAGHFAYNQSTSARIAFSATAPDSVGWAEDVERDISALDVEATARRSVEKALAGRSPREIKPGRYEVILEPAAVSDLLSSFVWVQMNAKAVDEGRSFLSGKKGTKVVASSIDMYSDPVSAQCPACPFDGEGMKLGRVDWIRSGVVENLLYSRFWAKKQGCAFTGWPHNMIVKGGQTSREEMIKSTKRGLLITRFWYIRTVDRMRDLYTGTTRDGTFLIKNGEIAGPVKNLRFNDSAARLLNKVEVLGEQQTTTAWGLSRVPLLKAKDFNFTSTTEF